MKIKEKDYYIAFANLILWEMIILFSALMQDKYKGEFSLEVFVTMAEFILAFVIPIVIGLVRFRKAYKIILGIITSVLIFGSINSILFAAIMYLNGGIQVSLRLVIIAVLNIIFIFNGIYWFLNIIKDNKN